MTMNRELARRWLREGRFQDLFREELGWDASSVGRHTVTVDEHSSYTLEAVAHKRGLVAFLHRVDGDPPPDQIRGKIERRLNKDFREHLVIYYRTGTGAQIWEWAHREPGRPIRRRHVAYDPTNPRDSGEPLLQRLNQISFSLEQEADLALTDVIRASEAAFDVDKVTKRFYDRFKKEHDAFAKFLQGVPDKAMAAWYVSVMLNRLMFIYFIQRKGFLDGDPHYLRNRLERVRRDLGPDRYYQDFLCPLFFEGFARREADRSPAMRTLLGDVPYLDGGLFQRHEVEERYGQAIQIPDAALERVLNYFDEYEWHLDTRPQRDNNEINPDVLGYIFEKYINQKEMGAYYTKEDITGYISRNTIIPRLFDLAAQRYPGRAADNPLRPEGWA